MSGRAGELVPEPSGRCIAEQRDRGVAATTLTESDFTSRARIISGHGQEARRAHRAARMGNQPHQGDTGGRARPHLRGGRKDRNQGWIEKYEMTDEDQQKRLAVPRVK
jgi:hypothetical protein